MASAACLDLPLRRSRCRNRTLACGVALGALALMAAGLPLWLTAGGVLVLAGGAWRSARAPWPQRLVRGPRGAWRIHYSNGYERSSPDLRRVRTTRVVTALTLAGQADGGIVLFADAFRDGDHTRLNRVLRHSHNRRP